VTDTEEKKPRKTALSREISLSRKSKYPTKASMNFIFDDQKRIDRIAIFLFGVFLVFLALFTKLAVIDPMLKISRAESAYNQMQETLAKYQEGNADYDTVKAQYDKAVGTFMTDDEKNRTERMAMIQMLEDDLINDVPVESIQITAMQISVKTGNTTLPVVSSLLSRMQADSRNSYVTVTTTAASNQENSDEVVADFEITYAASVNGGGSNA